MDKDDILRRLRAALPELQRDFGVSGAGLFGSVARGDARVESDVDVLVDLSRPLTYFDLAYLQAAVSRSLGREADVVARTDVRPSILRAIERDLIPV